MKIKNEVELIYIKNLKYQIIFYLIAWHEKSIKFDHKLLNNVSTKWIKMLAGNISINTIEEIW